MNKLTAVALVLLSPVALCAGFKLDVQSSRATGMGAAVTAFIDDPSAIYFNPAGISGRKGLGVQLGDTLILPAVTFTHAEDGDVTTTPLAVSPPVHAYATFGLTENLAIGIGVYSPFGASGNWPEKWEGRFKAIRSSLQTFNINPTLAYRLHPRLKVGLGFQAVRGTLFIERALNFVDSEGSVQLGGGAWGFGWNAGVQIEIVEKRLFFGGSYRGPVTMNFEGRSHFTNIPVEFGSRLKDQPITGEVVLPTQANFGFTVMPMDNLRISLDGHYVEWSAFPALAIKFENPDLTVPLKKDWVDQVSVHLGGEFNVTRSVAVRLGFVYDPTPSPRYTLTPDIPDSTRIKIAAGVGWQHQSGLSADLGYQFVALTGAESLAAGFEGTYGGTAQVIGLTLGYRLPVKDEPAAEPLLDPGAPAPAADPAPAPAADPAPAKDLPDMDAAPASTP